MRPGGAVEAEPSNRTAVPQSELTGVTLKAAVGGPWIHWLPTIPVPLASKPAGNTKT